MYLAYRYIKRKRQEKRAQEEAENRQRQSTANSGLASDNDAVPLHRYETVAGEASIDTTPAATTTTTVKLLTPEQKAERKRRYIYRCKIIFGLMMPFTLQGLDTTIVASALPFIAADFGKLLQSLV